MNQEIKELQKELKAIQKQEDKLRNKATDIQFKIRDLKEKELSAKVSKIYHVGDYFVYNNGITNYHCDVLTVHEVLGVATGRWPQVRVREYRIGYSDGDYYTHIEKVSLKYFDKVGKKVNQKQFEELKEIIYNPERYENSQWDVTER